MFLITTEDQRFWRTDEPVLFLGEWCRLFSERTAWEGLSYEVLPYHWDDRGKLYRDYLYLNGLYERVLPDLSERLNRLHGAGHTVRYWRIVIGPWLYCFIQSFYDRYQSILDAAASGKVTNTLIGRYPEGRWVPRDYPEFQRWARDDDYNHYLYDLIIEHTGGIPFDVMEADAGSDARLRRENKIREDKMKGPFDPKRAVKHFMELYAKAIPARFNRVVFVSSYLDARDQARLQLSLGQFPYVLSPEAVLPETAFDRDARERLSCDISADGFERLLGSAIKEQIPSVYVEGYGRMNRISLDTYPRDPEVIFTANAFNANETFKFWAAHNIDRGARLAGTQHGGHYGTGLWSASEEHQCRIFDRFYTWGWESETYKNTISLPAAKLNTIRRTVRSRVDGRLLMVLTTMSRYSYHMYSAFVASSGTLSYFNDQYRFVRALSEENRRSLLVRLYQADYGWSQKERWADEFPGIECYQGKRSVFEQLNESSLFIGTYNATTYLETFAADFPTVLFWDPDHWGLRDSARPYFEGLRRSGILHDTPESAAAKVNEISDNPVSWWRQPVVQKAKDRFCRRFARVSDDWLDEWKKELRRV
ncbi:LIC12162 family protein [Candidatus Omnitrophota bacterium]